MPRAFSQSTRDVGLNSHKRELKPGLIAGEDALPQIVGERKGVREWEIKIKIKNKKINNNKK